MLRNRDFPLLAALAAETISPPARTADGFERFQSTISGNAWTVTCPFNTLIDVDDRGQCAATEAANRFYSCDTIRVGVLARWDAELATQLFKNPIRPRNVAGRASANLHHVLAARPRTKLGVK